MVAQTRDGGGGMVARGWYLRLLGKNGLGDLLAAWGAERGFSGVGRGQEEQGRGHQGLGLRCCKPLLKETREDTCCSGETSGPEPAACRECSVTDWVETSARKTRPHQQDPTAGRLEKREEGQTR